MPVSTAPTSTPKIGFSNIRNRLRKAGTSASPETAADIVSIPNISVAKPSRIVPVSFFLSDLENIRNTVPTSASTGVKEVGLRSRMKKLSPEMPPRLKIHAVTVVPMFAPIITPMDCRSVISFELTKPTTITVVAEELWMTAVTPIPVRKPLILLFVSLPSSALRPFPARRSRPSPITFIPNRNRQRPPIIVNASKIVIRTSPDVLFLKSPCYMRLRFFSIIYDFNR